MVAPKDCFPKSLMALGRKGMGHALRYHIILFNNAHLRLAHGTGPDPRIFSGREFPDMSATPMEARRRMIAAECIICPRIVLVGFHDKDMIII